MSKRITIVVDDDIDKKLRNVQANVIKKRHTTYSYSRVINDLLREQLK